MSTAERLRDALETLRELEQEIVEGMSGDEPMAAFCRVVDSMERCAEKSEATQAESRRAKATT